MSELNKTFQEIVLSDYIIKIPPYQRAYAWKEKQLDDFIKDLEVIEDKTYYYGHFIIEKNNETYEIIDGQQRITTFVLFLLACKKLGYEISDELKSFIEKRFKTIEYDAENFNVLVNSILNGSELNICEQSKTSSFKRIEKTIEYFEKKKIDNQKFNQYINTLLNANISIHVVEDKSVAVQIFELQNSRGIKLDLLEKVKAKLMKELYLACDKNIVDEKIKIVQNCFSNVYKLEEKTIENSFRGNLSLDIILLLHLRVIDDGSKLKENVADNSLHSPSYNNHNESILEYIAKQISDVKDIVSYVINLSEFFQKSVEFVCQTLVEEDTNNPLVGDCIILERNVSIELFLILLHLNRFSELNLKMWELLLFTRDFHSKYYNKKGVRDNFQWLFHYLISKEINVNLIIDNFLYLGFRGGKDKYRLQEVFNNYIIEHKENITKNAFSFWKEKMTYLLYKYEINLDKTIREDLRKIFKDRKSLEHILPQTREFEWYGNNQNLNNQIKQIENGIGNLIILTTSENSKESNKHPRNKIYSIKKGSYEKHYNNKNEWDNSENWKNLILNRSEEIYGFLTEYFKEDAKPSYLFEFFENVKVDDISRVIKINKINFWYLYRFFERRFNTKNYSNIIAKRIDHNDRFVIDFNNRTALGVVFKDNKFELQYFTRDKNVELQDLKNSEYQFSGERYCVNLKGKTINEVIDDLHFRVQEINDIV